MKFGALVFRQWPLTRSMRYFRSVEELGYDAISCNDGLYLGQDPFVLLAAAACETREVRLGTNVSPMMPNLRRPADLAASIASLNELSGGRAILGVGSGGSIVEELGERAQKKPMLAQKEGVLIIKGLLAGQTVTYQGEIFRIKNAKIFNPNPRIPVIVGAQGPKMIEMSGEVADGVVLPRLSFTYCKTAMEFYMEGLRRSGRKLSEVELWANVLVFLSDDKDQIFKTVRPLVAHVLGHRRDTSTRMMGFTDDFVEAIAKDARAGEYGLVTDDMVEDFVICGTPEDCIKRVREYNAIGVNQLNLVLGYDEKSWWETINAFGKSVISTFKES